MGASENDILTWFADKNFACDLVRHPATATAAEGRSVRAELPGLHSKSLFVTDKTDRLILVMARSDIRADLKGLGQALSAKGRLSFAAPERMIEAVGVAPGHLSPLALINDGASAVDTVVVDKGLMQGTLVWCHPLHNEASVGLSPEAIIAFIRAHGPEPRLIDIALPTDFA